MFMHCPTCRALVATEPATGLAPPYCPICSAPIGAAQADAAQARATQAGTTPADASALSASPSGDARPTAASPAAPAADARAGAAASDHTAGAAAADDASASPTAAPSRLAAMLSSLHADDGAASAATDASAASRRHASPDAPMAWSDDGHGAAARPAHVRERPPGPAPLEVIRSPVDALRDAVPPPTPASATASAGLSRTTDERRLQPATDTLLQRLAGRSNAAAGDPRVGNDAAAPPSDQRAPAESRAQAATSARVWADDMRSSNAGEHGQPNTRHAAVTAGTSAEARASVTAASDVAAATTAAATLNSATPASAHRSGEPATRGSAAASVAPAPPAAAPATATATATAPANADAAATLAAIASAPSAALPGTALPAPRAAASDSSDAAAVIASAAAAPSDAAHVAIVRPVDRPRAELPSEPSRSGMDSRSSIDALSLTPMPVAKPAALVATLPIGVAKARSTPSFARQRRHASSGFGPVTLTAIGVLTLTLLLQLMLADRAALAANARWRPLVSALCGALGISVPPWREPTAFVLVERDVRVHPSRSGALRATATFRNDARWPQPWPRLSLTLSDADGSRLGTRDFSPTEYLGAAPREPLLAPGQSASLAIDVVEPARTSVAFDFRLH